MANASFQVLFVVATVLFNVWFWNAALLEYLEAPEDFLDRFMAEKGLGALN